MPTLPDSFDVAVRRAREMNRGQRQVDYTLGLLFAQSEWHFVNHGTAEKPFPALIDLDTARVLVIFSSLEKYQDFVELSTETPANQSPSISIPVEVATGYCLQFRPAGCQAILVNPGEFAFQVSLEALKEFDENWRSRPDTARGFWIPNMTTEEEDFWNEHGL
jgi:hypothetical protein